MKTGKRRKTPRANARKAFVRGFVATALLTKLDRRAGGFGGLSREGVRLALRGGIAIASGTIVADALERRRYSRSMLALAAGAACLAITYRCLTTREPEQAGQDDGEEEVQKIQG